MKKFYLVVSMAFAITFLYAQRVVIKPNAVHGIMNTKINSSYQTFMTADTIDDHFIGATPTIYTAQGGGFVVGNNAYNDIGKMQLFDPVHGVTTGGTITNILFWFGAEQGNPSSTFTAKIWSDIAGKPGTVLGSVAVTFADIDTSAAGTFPTTNAAYNTIATFTTPVNIPTNRKFWAGMSIDTLPGDTIGLVTSTSGDFADAATNTFEQWNDGTYHTFNDGTNNSWQLDIAIGVFPVVDFWGVGINDINNTNGIKLFQNQPNPFNKTSSINYEIVKSANVSLEIYDIVGRKLMIVNEGNKNTGKHSISIDANKFARGIYFYTLKANETSLTNRMVITE